jgi:hypothetical protein
LYPTFPGVYRDSSQEPRAEGYLCTMQGTGWVLSLYNMCQKCLVEYEQ